LPSGSRTTPGSSVEKSAHCEGKTHDAFAVGFDTRLPPFKSDISLSVLFTGSLDVPGRYQAFLNFSSPKSFTHVLTPLMLLDTSIISYSPVFRKQHQISKARALIPKHRHAAHGFSCKILANCGFRFRSGVNPVIAAAIGEQDAPGYNLCGKDFRGIVDIFPSWFQVLNPCCSDRD
jgi:hypothetical protein